MCTIYTKISEKGWFEITRLGKKKNTFFVHLESSKSQAISHTTARNVVRHHIMQFETIPNL